MKLSIALPPTARAALEPGLARVLAVGLAAALLAGCAARQLEDSLAGSTSQRLVSYGIDDLVAKLPEDELSVLKGKRVYIESHSLAKWALKNYADRRLAMELTTRFGARVVTAPELAEQTLHVFYTSLGTDQSFQGFFIPLGFIPGVAEQARINLITLEQFHGVAEMYYYIGEPGEEVRGSVLQARVRTDALGLPIITIPISTVDRH